MQKRPAPRRIGNRVVTTETIAPGAVTSETIAPGAVSTDPSIIEDIETAQATADGKNKIYRQTTQPPGTAYSEGDLWFDTDDGNKFYRFTSGSWVAFTLGDAALASISASKITAGTIDASVITVSNINAGNITAGVISSGRINTASISAADVNADRITAGILSSIQIRAGTPVSGVYPFSVSTAGAVRAVSGEIGAFSLSGTTLSASSLATGTGGATANISLAAAGQINTRINFDNGIGTTWYVDTFINKADDQGGINVEGTASGVFKQTRIRSSFVQSEIHIGEEFQHGTSATGRYTSSDTHTRIGSGSTNVGAFRVANGVNVYDQVVSGRDVFINNNGTLGYATSSLRYKEEVNNLLVDYKDVLKIEPVTFYYKPGMVADLTYENREIEVGVIAEQVEEIGSLHHLLTYTGDQIQGFKYNRLTVYLLEVCRKQEEAIEDLKARISALES
jgi:hypothetical protein